MDSIFKFDSEFKQAAPVFTIYTFPQIRSPVLSIIFLKSKEALLLCHFQMFGSGSPSPSHSQQNIISSAMYHRNAFLVSGSDSLNNFPI